MHITFYHKQKHFVKLLMCSLIFAPFTPTQISHFLSPVEVESVGTRNHKYSKLHSV